MAWWARNALIGVLLGCHRVAVSTGRAWVSDRTCTTWAVVAHSTDSTLVLRLFTASVTNGTCLAVSDTPRIECVIEGASWAGDHSQVTFLAIATLGAGYELEISRTWLTVVAWWAVLTHFSSFGPLGDAKFAFGALGLNATNAI